MRWTPGDATALELRGMVKDNDPGVGIGPSNCTFGVDGVQLVATSGDGNGPG